LSKTREFSDDSSFLPTALAKCVFRVHAHFIMFTRLQNTAIATAAPAASAWCVLQDRDLTHAYPSFAARSRKPEGGT
jgi:hypothetical protein